MNSHKEYQLTAIAVIVFIAFCFLYVDNDNRWDDYITTTENVDLKADTLKIVKHTLPTPGSGKGTIIFEGNRKGVYYKTDYPLTVIHEINMLDEGNTVSVCFKDSINIIFPKDFLIE